MTNGRDGLPTGESTPERTEHTSTVPIVGENEAALNRGDSVSRSETGWITLSIQVQFVTKLVKGLVIPKLLAPRLYGLYQSLTLVLRYGRYADLGIVHLLARRLPAVLTREGEEGFERELARALCWSLLATSVVALGLIGLAFFQTGPSAWFYRVGFPVVAAIVVARQLREILSNSARAREWYRVVAQGSILLSSLGLALAVALLVAFDVLGLVVSLLVVEVAAVSYFLGELEWPGLRTVPLHRIKTLLVGSLTLLLLSVAELVLTTVDQLFVLGFFDKTQYGIYALGLFVSNTALSVSGIYLTIIHPKMMRHIEEGDAGEAHRLMSRALVGYLAVLAVALPLGYPILWWFVDWYLPDYASGLPVYFLFAGMAVVRGPVLLLQPYFIARNRVRKVLKWYGGAVVLAALLDGAVMASGGGVLEILLASVVAYLALVGALLYVFERSGSRKVETSKYALLLLAAGTVAAFAVRLEAGLAAGAEVRSLAVVSAATLVGTAGVAWWHRGFVRESVRYFWF